MKIILIFFILIPALIAHADVCDELLATSYTKAINELAHGYILSEKMKTEGTSSVATLKTIEKELSKKRLELIKKIGQKEFKKHFKRALKDQIADDARERGIHREGRRKKLVKENEALEIWTVDTEIISSSGWIISTDISSNGELMALGYYKGTQISIVDTKTGQEIRAINGHKQMVEAVSFSPDDTMLVSASADGKVRISRVTDGSLVKRFVGHKKMQMTAASFSPDGKLVVTASHDRTVRIWDVETGKEIKRFITPGKYSFQHSAAFSPDGKTIAMGGTDNTVRLWDLETDTIVKEFVGHTNWVTELEFSRDGLYLLTAGGNSIRLWEISSGNVEVFSSSDAENSIYSARLSPDGLKIIAGYEDHTAVVWDIKTKKQLFVLNDHRDQLSFAGFTPDSQSIITAGFDDRALIWKLQRSVDEDAK